MSKPKPETKICKHCQTEIPYKAKVCPQCRKKQGGKLKWIIIGILILIVAIGAFGGGDDTDSTDSTKTESAEKKEKKEKKKIDYTKVSAVELDKVLDKNAAKAAKQYKGKYLEISGTLGNIDSDLSYFDVDGNDFDFTIIQCYIQNEEQENIILEMEQGDKITVRGKCTDVGELMGYSIEVDSIK